MIKLSRAYAEQLRHIVMADLDYGQIWFYHRDFMHKLIKMCNGDLNRVIPLSDEIFELELSIAEMLYIKKLISLAGHKEGDLDNIINSGLLLNQNDEC